MNTNYGNIIIGVKNSIHITVSDYTVTISLIGGTQAFTDITVYLASGYGIIPVVLIVSSNITINGA